MTRKTYTTKRDVTRDMNLALDGALSDPTLAGLKAHLGDTPVDAALWNRMQKVDTLFSDAPTMQAPPDFSRKLMASIAAGAATNRASIRRPARFRAVLGVLLVALVMTPVAVFAVNAIHGWLSDPAALSTLLQQVVSALNAVSQAVVSIFQLIASFTTGNPILPALLITTIPLVMLWGWLMWYTSMRRQQVVYRIPVSVA